jgi:UDP-N-acetylglucosamine:LPS N-acetylglucosamine transferase
MKAKLIKRKIIASTISEAIEQLKENYPCCRLITTRVKDDDRLRKNKKRQGDKIMFVVFIDDIRKCWEE